MNENNNENNEIFSYNAKIIKLTNDLTASRREYYELLDIVKDCLLNIDGRLILNPDIQLYMLTLDTDLVRKLNIDIKHLTNELALCKSKCTDLDAGINIFPTKPLPDENI